VTNLLDNAVKWSPPEGTVRIRLNHGTLTVDDEGPGIAPGDRDHVFDRFYRSEESRSMPGSGLGLSIVRQVIERHAGNVRADVNDHGGTRMVMQVPGAPLLAH
jgi:two-component system sensor histidine kinase MprB